MNYPLLIEQIKRHEGLKLKPYHCSKGKLTIGYGRNLDDVGISKDEAEELLLNDLSKVETKLEASGILRGHNEARNAVIFNMCFQLGFAGLLKFKRMLAAFTRKEYELAAKEMLDSRWALQTPNRAKELHDQMLTGEFQ